MLQCLEVDGVQRPPALRLVFPLLTLAEPHHHYAKNNHGHCHGKSDPWHPVARVKEELDTPFFGALRDWWAGFIGLCWPWWVDDDLRVGDQRLELGCRVLPGGCACEEILPVSTISRKSKTYLDVVVGTAQANEGMWRVERMVAGLGQLGHFLSALPQKGQAHLVGHGVCLQYQRQ